jgi:hypothetical protein
MLNSDCEYCKGEYVRHPKRSDWGVGIVVEDQRGDVVKVFFENQGNIKSLKVDLVSLDKVTDPGSADVFLLNVLVDEDSIAKGDRQPFPAVVKKFIEDFPGGFHGKMLNHFERKYKVEAHEWMKEHLSQERWKKLIESKEFDELSQEIKRLFSKANLLASFEMIKLGDALKIDEAKEAIGCAFYDLLYKEGNFKDRFDNAAKILGRYEVDKWTTITYPLFFCFPDKYMFVKPMVTQQAALNRGFDIQYSPELNWNTYNQIQIFSKDIFDRLSQSKNEALHPKDMIDVQSFMWCTYGKGWSAEEIAEGKVKLGIA